MKKRIFIVGPSGFDSYMGDKVPQYWVACETYSKDNFGDIYDSDDYRELGTYMTRVGAINCAKKHGVKKVTII